eukprot:scaffold335138_cov65-Attheya_sp.AAC.3
MLRIQDNSPNGYRNLPSTMPIWDIWNNHGHFVSYTNPVPHMARLRDPFCEHPTSPCVANEENWIRIAGPQDYNQFWMRDLQYQNTRHVLMNMITTPIIPQGWHCHDGAPIDIEGFPITQRYVEGTDEYVHHGPHPAISTINRDHPTESIPSNFILTRWPTGPDLRITLSNPLYQFARPNVPMHECELLQFPDIHAFNDEFFEAYDLTTNMIATAFHNTPHKRMDYFCADVNYSVEPPNLNGQFVVLHHNFYGESFVDDVYEVDPSEEFDILCRYESVKNELWEEMDDEELMQYIDNTFLLCNPKPLLCFGLKWYRLLYRVQTRLLFCLLLSSTTILFHNKSAEDDAYPSCMPSL